MSNRRTRTRSRRRSSKKNTRRRVKKRRRRRKKRGSSDSVLDRRVRVPVSKRGAWNAAKNIIGGVASMMTAGRVIHDTVRGFEAINRAANRQRANAIERLLRASERM